MPVTDATRLLQVKLQGIPGIRKVFMRELKTTHLDQEGIYQTENQWVLDTEGVNLLDVRLPLESWLHMPFALFLPGQFTALPALCIDDCKISYQTPTWWFVDQISYASCSSTDCTKQSHDAGDVHAWNRLHQDNQQPHH